MKILITLLFAVLLFRAYFLFLEQRSLYHPSEDIKDTPRAIGVEYEEVYFKAADGTVLNGWFVPAKNARITMLYCHGNAGNSSHRLHKVKFFHEMGVNFFIFDYRGYGKSKGFPYELGLYRDACAAYDYVVSRPDIDKGRIVAYGKSLGAAVAIDLCLRRSVRALMVEGAFLSVLGRAKELYPLLPMKLLVLQKFDNLNKIERITIPKFISHALDDEVIPFAHGEVLYGKAQEPKQFLPFEGLHSDDEFVTSSAYKGALKAFFDKYAI